MPSMQTNSPYKGSGSISREQFLFYEMRTTARLLAQGVDDKELVKPAATLCGGRMGCTCLCTVTTARKFAGMWC